MKRCDNFTEGCWAVALAETKKRNTLEDKVAIKYYHRLYDKLTEWEKEDVLELIDLYYSEE